MFEIYLLLQDFPIGCELKTVVVARARALVHKCIICVLFLFNANCSIDE